MSCTAYEPLELDLDLFEGGRDTLPSVYSVPLPPVSGKRVRFPEVEELDLFGMERADDIDDAAYVFAEVETATSAETPDAKRRETMRALAPPPSLASGPSCSGPATEPLPWDAIAVFLRTTTPNA